MGSDKRQRQKEARQARLEAERTAMRRQSRTRTIVWGAVIAAVVFGVLLLIASTGGDDEEVTAGDDTAADEPAELAPTDYGEGECPPEEGVDEPVRSFDSAPRRCIDDDVDYQAVIKTASGDITVDLFEDKAPANVNSFVVLSRYDFYQGSSFFRIIEDFVIQGGSPGDRPPGQGGPGYQLIDELPEPAEYRAGSLAMANRGPNTSGSQFFILTTDAGAESLVASQGGRAAYTLLGEVIEGMEVVRQIAAEEVVGDRAVEPVAIEDIEIIEA